MKKVIIRNSPTIICVQTNKVRLLTECSTCSAFRGFHKSQAKDAKINTAIKCDLDER